MKIEKIEVSGLFGHHDIVWENIKPDVNILVGSNGSFKTTLLNIIRSVLQDEAIGVDIKDCAIYLDSGTILRPFCGLKDLNCIYLDSMMYRFENVVCEYSRHMTSLIDKFLENKSQNPDDIFSRVSLMIELINEGLSGKKIISRKLEIEADNGDKLKIEDLSDGEKQYIALMIKALCCESGVLLLDQPEYSLHMDAQETLIENLQKLSPECQIFIVTHAPCIIRNWVSEVIGMDQITKK